MEKISDKNYNQSSKIYLIMGGIVVFDPAATEEYIKYTHITGEDLLTLYTHQLDLNHSVLKSGLLIPIYPIEECDFEINLIFDSNSMVDKQWHLFKSTFEYPLIVKSNKVLIGDIVDILDPDKDMLTKKQIGIDEDFQHGACFFVENGSYAVTIVGFRDINNDDYENRRCGYEFYLRKVDQLPIIDKNDLTGMHYVIDGWTPGSY